MSLAGPPSDARLAELCERVATSLDAGIDVRRVWRSEFGRQRGRLREACERVAAGVDAGDPLDETLATRPDVFPPLLRELARVGERTGATPEAFRRLGEHYRRRLESTRRLRSLVAWPLIQLGIAAVVVGVLIAIGGVLTGLRGEPLDLLGFGLVGAGGLVAYTMLVGGTVAAAVLAWLWLRRTPEVAARVAAALSGVPVVGRCVELITLARIAWALRLLLNVDLDLRRVAPLAMRVSGNARYARLGEPIAAAIERGEPLSAAIEQTHTFPRDFIDTLRVAEETGRLSESMAALSTRYEQDAQRATQTLCGVAAGAIWLGVAGLIVWLIFRVAGFYTGVIYDAIDGL